MFKLLSCFLFCVSLVAGKLIDKHNGLLEMLKKQQVDKEVVRLDLYYESLCPGCKLEYPSVVKLVTGLGDQLDLHTYPYGNALKYNISGNIVINCQHGDEECYGNKLHACAIEAAHNKAIIYAPFVNCLMQSAEDDAHVDSCGATLKFNADTLKCIKSCAKGAEGEKLLEMYGEETDKVSKPGVPYFLINQKKISENYSSLIQAVCAAFKVLPEACKNMI